VYQRQSLACELIMTQEEEEAEFLAEQNEKFISKSKDIVANIKEEVKVMAETNVKTGDLFFVFANEKQH
ncbi:hypothetical protein, partial [Staphylococcus aureus]